MCTSYRNRLLFFVGLAFFMWGVVGRRTCIRECVCECARVCVFSSFVDKDQILESSKSINIPRKLLIVLLVLRF